MLTSKIRAATALVAFLVLLAPVAGLASQADTAAADTDTASVPAAPDTASEPATTAEPAATPAPEPAPPAAVPLPEPKPKAARPSPLFKEEPEEDLPPPKPPISRGFVAGTHEAALGLATAGSGDYFYFGASGLYAHYVIKGLAPGIEVQYAHIFANEDYPDSLSLMPFLKYAFTVSETVAPYLIIGGGRSFEWGVEEEWHKADSWFLGGGIGAHIGLGERWAIKLQVLFLHHWYDGTKVYDRPDEELFKDEYGNQYHCGNGVDCDDVKANYPAESATYHGPRWNEDEGQWIEEGVCDEAADDYGECLLNARQICDADDENCLTARSDLEDKTREWIYPVITFGLSFVF